MFFFCFKQIKLASWFSKPISSVPIFFCQYSSLVKLHLEGLIGRFQVDVSFGLLDQGCAIP